MVQVKHTCRICFVTDFMLTGCRACARADLVVAAPTRQLNAASAAGSDDSGVIQHDP